LQHIKKKKNKKTQLWQATCHLYSSKAALSPHPARRTAVSYPPSSAAPRAHGISEGVPRAGSVKGKTCHKPAPRPAWQQRTPTAPGKLAEVLDGRPRSSNLLKTTDRQQQPRCILRCQTKRSVMGLENRWHFTVPLWWLKREGHTHQWTDHGTETTFQQQTEITVLVSKSECSLIPGDI